MAEELAAFRSEKEWTERKVRWDGWTHKMRTYAIHRSNGKTRERMKQWKAEEGLSSQPSWTQGSQLATTPEAQVEVQSHDWMEGARMGEAQNPGPWGQHHIGSRVPNARTKQAQAPARWHGTRAVPQAPAGERTKGIYPGPNPSDDQIGNRPVGSGRGSSNSAAMKTNRSSRAGSAQRKPPSPPPRRHRIQGGQRAARSIAVPDTLQDICKGL